VFQSRHVSAKSYYSLRFSNIMQTSRD
jgi:hypothetical protein